MPGLQADGVIQVCFRRRESAEEQLLERFFSTFHAVGADGFIADGAIAGNPCTARAR